ncbi:phage tail protein I [Pseudomonas sp. RTCS2]|uniref:phage tail protein I n=1 Tax=Pseudomonas sp. RTCS2 TaxID=3389877 RepID=UPI0039E407A4
MTVLLPPNASQLERLAAEALAQIDQVPVPIRDLLNPDRCPVAMLPYLAWAFSVDRWDANWGEATKRQVIKSSYYVHSHKGTIGALRRVIEPLGYRIKVTEWWETQPEGTPGTFSLDIEVLDAGISEATYELLNALIGDAKPLSRHVAELNLIGVVAGPLTVATTLQDGHETSIYPYAPRHIESAGQVFFSVAIYDGDSTSIFPKAPAAIESQISINAASTIVSIDTVAVYPQV